MFSAAWKDSVDGEIEKNQRWTDRWSDLTGRTCHRNSKHETTSPTCWSTLFAIWDRSSLRARHASRESLGARATVNLPSLASILDTHTHGSLKMRARDQESQYWWWGCLATSYLDRIHVVFFSNDRETLVNGGQRARWQFKGNFHNSKSIFQDFTNTQLLISKYRQSNFR